MELFKLSIPVLEETCLGLEKDIETYGHLAQEARDCCQTLTDHGWEGNAKEQFVKNYIVWYADSTEFIHELKSLYEILTKTLERAKTLNAKALGFPEIMEGSGSGDGSKNILTYNVDSKDTIDYCHRSLQNDYDDEEDILESANRYLSGMSYAKETESRLTLQVSECISEGARQKQRLQNLQQELGSYGDGIRDLEEAVIKVTSEFKMWEGWTSRLLEMTQQLTQMLPEDKGLNQDWIRMQEFISSNWNTLTAEEQAVLLDQLGLLLKGKAIQGVEDPRTVLDLLVLEEKGYLTIGDKGIVYQNDYINNQLSRTDLSEKELAEINSALEFMFGDGKKASVVVASVQEFNTLERIQLDVYMRIHKEELMKENLIWTDEDYNAWRENAFVILELWQRDYRELTEKMLAMSEDEFYEAYPSGIGTPRDDMVFLGEITSFPLEERIQILEALKSEEGMSVEKLGEILGRNDRALKRSHADISMTYNVSRLGMTMEEGYNLQMQAYFSQIQAGMNMTILPMALGSVYDSTRLGTPKKDIYTATSNESLDPEKSSWDKREVQISKGEPIVAEGSSNNYNLVNPLFKKVIINGKEYAVKSPKIESFKLNIPKSTVTLSEVEIAKLKSTVIDEGQVLKDMGLTRDQLGPAISGAYDKTTGKTYTAINNINGKVPDELSPLLADRIKNMPQSIKILILILMVQVHMQRYMLPIKHYLQILMHNCLTLQFM